MPDNDDSGLFLGRDRLTNEEDFLVAFLLTGKRILYISGRDLFTIYTGSEVGESSLTRSFAWNSF